MCEHKLGTEFYLSLTQFNVKEGYSPLVICDDCFNDLNINGNLYDQNDIYNKNIFCIHEDNIILRKVLIWFCFSIICIFSMLFKNIMFKLIIIDWIFCYKLLNK